MREIRSYGSVGERGGNKPLYPENPPRQLGVPGSNDSAIKFIAYFN